MNRYAQAALMFLVGAAVLHAGTTDLYLRYVKAGLRPLLLVAGVVLIVAAIAIVWYERRQARTTPDTRPEHHDGHVHHEPRVAWLLILPVLALVLVTPPALDSYSGMRAGTALPKPFGFAALPAGNPLPLTLSDYAGRAVYDHGHSLGGRTMTITGFVAFDRNGSVYLIRMFLSCCAADAQPVKIGLSGRIPPVLKPDTWLEITGTYTGRQTKDPVNDGVIPFIDVTEARSVPAPSDPYEQALG